MTMLFAKFRNYILENELISTGEKVVVSVSGGIDSMVMLDMLARLSRTMKLDLIVAHANHGLRGKASDADETLVRQTAQKFGILCDAKRLVPSKKDNIQDAARMLRQRFLKQVVKKRGARAVCLGHHLGDQAETVLLHLIRGSGLSGLRGMSPLSFSDELRIVRPLLFATRTEIEKYASEMRIAFREDATNAKMRYRRNELRHRLMPLIREFNPRIETRIALMAKFLAEDDDALEAVTNASLEEALISEKDGLIELSRKIFITMPSGIRRRMLRLAYKRLVGSSSNLNSDQLMRMDLIALSTRPAAEYKLKAPWRFAKKGQLLIIYKSS